MTFLQTAYGYDIYELSAIECEKHRREFPRICCFYAGAVPEEKKTVDQSEIETLTVADMLDWCKEHRRDNKKFEEIKPGDLFTLDGCQHKLIDNVAAQTYEVQVIVKITAENIENIVVSALECSSTYWVGLDNTTPEWDDAPKNLPVSQYCAALLLAGKTVKLYDVEDDSETWELTLEKLLKGIGREIANGFKISDIEEEADAALQYALFDEVVYG